MNILSIQSWVAYGHVGNAAAVFPLQRLGAEVWPVHTGQFSNHPGYGDWRGEVFSGAAVEEVIDGLAARGALARCDAILSGYLGRAETGAAVASAVSRARAANPALRYCCDPVLGDDERGCYVDPAVAACIQEHCLPQADLATPNRFELEWLTGVACSGLDATRQAMAALAARMRGWRTVLATSIRTEATPPGSIDMLAMEDGACLLLRTPELPVTVHGAGDALAALFLYHRLHAGALKPALERAASALFGVLRRSAEAGAREMLLVAAQEEIVTPRMQFSAVPC